MLGNNNSGSSGTHSRRSVLKGIGALGAAAVAGTSMSGSAAAQIGDSAVYQYYHTDWTQITDDLSTLADAGYDAIQVPPAQFSRIYKDEREFDEFTYDLPLGYQPIDFTDFDSEFGTEDEYATMVEEAHNQGLDVIADAVMNHVAAYGDNFRRDVSIEDIPRFSEDDLHPQCEIDYSDPESVEDCWLVGLRDLDQDSSYVRGELKNYLEKYANLGVDGIRFDAAKHMSESFFSNYANQWADELDLYRFGEVLSGSKQANMSYANTGMSVTDFALYFVMKEQVFNSYGDMNALEGAGVVNEDPTKALTFVSNHDKAPPEYERLAYAYVLTYEGYPRVYSHRVGVSDAEISQLLSIRRQLLSGQATTQYVDSDLYVFERGDALVVLNRGDSAASQWVQTGLGTGETLSDVTGSEADTQVNSDGYVQVSAPAVGYAVYSTQSLDGGDGGSGGDDGSDDETTGTTLQIDAPTADGESVYFTGSTSSLTNWGGGVEGTKSSGIWEVTIEETGDFEWKARRGPAGGSGDVWESGDNHTTLSPTFQGWADGFEGETGSADFGVSALNAPSSATTGDVITVSAEVTNGGDAEGTTTVEFGVDGTVDQSTDVSLGVDASTTVSFDYDTTGTEAGTVSVDISTPDDSQSATVEVASAGTTLRIEAPTADGESVYFAGSTSSLTNWGSGVEGTLVDGVWEVTVEATGDFEWKARRGPADGSGDVWESGDNHTTTEPTFQGWADGFEGGDSTTGTTLRISAPTADGESVYFTGNTDALTTWGGGVEGTYVDGAWEVTVEDTGDFQWKTRRGPSGTSGEVWESGSNHTSGDPEPTHNGWEDGFSG